MIKSLLNGTDHYCVFNIQPTAVLQMHLLVFLRIQPCLFETEIGVKILSCINLDFDRVTHFFLAVYVFRSNVRGGKNVPAVCLEVRIAMN